MASFVDEYVAYASEFCDAPNAYHYFCALGTLAAVVSRKVSMPFGVKDLHPNLWLLLVGTSGERKSSAIAIADYLLSRSEAAPIFPNEFSREALVEIFQRHGSGVFLISEYSNLMGMMRLKYNDGVIGFLTDIYDVPRDYKRESLGKGQISLQKPCPNIIAGTTPEYMKTSADEWFSGWGPRFIVVAGERRRLIPIPPVPNRDREQRLLNFLHNAKRMPPVNFYLPDPERDAFGGWAQEFDARMRKGHAHAKALGSRLYAAALKLAMLLQVSDHPDWLMVRKPMAFGASPGKEPVGSSVPIQMAYILKSAELIDALAKTTADVLWKSSVNKDPFSAKREKVLEVIMTIEQSGETCYFERLARAASMRPKELDEVLTSLLDSHLITEEEATLRSGRKTSKYSATKQRSRAPIVTEEHVPSVPAEPPPAEPIGVLQQQELPT